MKVKEMVQNSTFTNQMLQMPEPLVAQPSQKHLGIHLIAEFWDGKIIEEQREVERILLDAARRARSTALAISSHKFSPHGITAFVLLAESHISMHSWPEKNYLAVDIFTCGEKTMPFKALEYLKEIYQPKRVDVREIKRGKIR